MIEDIFEDETLDSKTFRLNKRLTVSGPDADRSYKLKEHDGLKKLKLDPLDEILVDILHIEKHFDEILHELAAYFDDGNSAKEKSILIKLLRIKLRKGIYDRLYEVNG